MSHEDVPEPFELPEHPEVEVISSIASPAGAHMSNALEQLWLATAAGTCSAGSAAGVDVHRRAVASVSASWFAMESAVNKTLYFKLRHRESPYFLAPGDRKQMDRQISDGLGGQLGFDQRLTYLAEDKECCSLVDDHRGKLRQFEKLRNSLVHGYVYRREALAESDPSTTKVSTNDNGNRNWTLSRQPQAYLAKMHCVS